jgi:tetratricopeptide (TPR) repeat protein
MRKALELATSAGEGREVALLYNNLAAQLENFRGPAAAIDMRRQGIAYAAPRGLLSAGVGLAAFLRVNLVDAGAHDEALRELADAIPEAGARGLRKAAAFWRLLETRMLVLRGEASACAEWLDEIERSMREEDLQGVVMGLVHVACARAAIGQTDAALSILAEVAARPDVTGAPSYPQHLPVLARTAVTVGAVDLGEQLVAGVEARTPLDQHSLVAARAVLAEGHGDTAAAANLYLDAADRWGGLATPIEEAYALLGAGRCLLALGRTAEAAVALERAHSLWGSLKAAPLLAETDAMLERTVSLSA